MIDIYSVSLEVSTVTYIRKGENSANCHHLCLNVFKTFIILLLHLCDLLFFLGIKLYTHKNEN